MVTKRIMLATFAVCALIVGSAGLAWACMIPGTTTGIRWSTSSGSVGTTVEATGSHWQYLKGPVEIVWSTSAGQVEQVLRSVQVDSDGSFNATVKVPAVALGDYRLSGRQSGLGEAGTNFRVTNPDGSSPVAGSTPVTGPTNPTNTPGASTVVIPGPPSAANQTGNQPGLVAAPATVGGSIGTAHTTAPALTEGATAAPAASAAGVALPSVAPSTSGAAAVPSVRSATGDLWSGFAAGPGHAPGLQSVPSGVPTQRGPSPAVFGLGLLLVGSVALLGGFGVAEARRRRAESYIG